jgi:hypothetical protein
MKDVDAGQDAGPERSVWRLRVDLSLESLTWLLVVLGVLLRVWEYLEFRQLYLDEDSLLKNLVGRSILEFNQILERDQMAPPGFLVIERLMLRLPLNVKAAGRLFPLVCGIASVFLMRGAARRYVDRWAVPIAVGLFALGDHLLYYSAEIKQYSCDLMLALAALLLAAPPHPAVMTRGRLWALGIFGLVAPWFSFPVVFMLAAVGAHLIVRELRGRDWRRAARAAAVCSTWLLSFAGCFLLSRSILSKSDFIWVWWDFAFLPIPPHSLDQFTRVAETLANVFINPVGLITPLPLGRMTPNSLPYTAGLASVLALIGCISLGRRWPGGLFLLTVPLLLALAASALHQYPFHGRLLLYLVPVFVLLPSEGMAALGRRTRWPVTLILAGLLFYGEALEITWHKAIQARARTFDSHGDLKSDLLDHLEYLRRQPRQMESSGTLDPAAGRESSTSTIRPTWPSARSPVPARGSARSASSATLVRGPSPSARSTRPGPARQRPETSRFALASRRADARAESVPSLRDRSSG